MKVGVVGVGVVGDAVRRGFEDLSHDVKIHDIRLDTKIQDVLETELCFLCVPTPSRDSGECNTDIVEQVIHQLLEMNYEGLICIKSTVTPGTTKRLQERFDTENICFVPEFLRERCAYEDFVKNHDLCAIGVNNADQFELIKEAHGQLPENFARLSVTEAEFCKYYNNVYNATLVTLANSFYELCVQQDADYTKIKDTMTLRNQINGKYLDCNPDLRGFGGMCLPKDTRAMAYLAKDTVVEFFDCLINENSKYKVTVFDGMRGEE
tara:strand:+ start:3521 stop:4315 length:795 start_codon:yes stop_codon:yes gene_type:complete